VTLPITHNFFQMTQNFVFFAWALALSSLFSACDKAEPTIPNEEELITTLNYVLTPTGGGAAVTLGFKDLDGDGGNAPIISGGTLAPNQTYTGALVLLNEITTPVVNISDEILLEDEDHQFFFENTLTGLTTAYADQDANGKPVGLSSTLTTGVAASGTITITLRHQPNKSATGVSGGNIANAGGETDIQVTFPVSVQ
jgi:hypothetical protein